METYEILLIPIYIVILTLFASNLKRKSTFKEQNTFFYYALFTKFFFAISAGLVYKYIYLGGDTYNFYQIAEVYFKCFTTEPHLILDMFMYEGGQQLIPRSIDHYNIYFYSWYRAETSAFFLSKIAGFFNLFSFNSYFLCSLFFGLISFWGNWHLYLTISKYYPTLYKKLSFVILFIPSVCFWSSGIFKDTITFACVGYLTYFLDSFFINKKRKALDLIIALICIYSLNTIKAYVLICFTGSGLFWYFFNIREKIQSNFMRNSITPLLLVIIITALFQVLNLVGENQQKYSVDNMFQTIQTAQDWHSQISAEDKKYSLGTYNQTFIGLLSILPQAVFIAIFRPFIWESGIGLMLLSALENLFITYLFLTAVLMNLNMFRKEVSRSPLIIYCIVFTITLAFMVGASSYNFGALTRYRVSFIPLLLSAILIIQHKVKISKSNKSS